MRQLGVRGGLIVAVCFGLLVLAFRGRDRGHAPSAPVPPAPPDVWTPTRPRTSVPASARAAGRARRTLGDGVLRGLLFTLVVAGCAIVLSGSVALAQDQTFVVTSAADNDDGTCNAVHCTLREALTLANAAPGHDTIVFNIPSLPGTVHTITAVGAPPVINNAVTINAASQPGYSGTPLIEYRGLNVPVSNGALTFNVNSGASTIRGLALTSWQLYAIENRTGTTLTIEDNYIGVSPDGVTPRGNLVGIFLLGGSNHVIDGNVISANTQAGLRMQAVSGATIQGNHIGTNAAGTGALGNGTVQFNEVSGVEIGPSTSGATASGIVIGGAGANQGNVISGNGRSGIDFAGAQGSTVDDTVIQGNRIGTNAAGTSAIPNGWHGIHIRSGNSGATTDTMIGGTGAGEGNTIAFNGRSGIAIASHAADPENLRNSIRRNAIHSNDTPVGVVDLGIDLGATLPPSVTANDPDDVDSGANGLQNFPVLTSAITAGPQTTINGSLNSTPSTNFTLEFFSNAACDGSGNGEGATFLGTIPVTTDSGGDVPFTTEVPAVAVGAQITATATDAAGNTSEFSACRAVTSGGAPQPGPTFTVNTTADAAPADVGCSTTDCTLREAILAANANGGADTIAFSIAGTGIHTIQPTTGLPNVTGPVTIDGTTESDYVVGGAPRIELDGSSAGPVVGLMITGANVTIRGLTINRFQGAAIQISSTATTTTIAANYIGLNLAGTAAAGNGNGIHVSSSGNFIGGDTAAERNVIAGNLGNALVILGDNNMVQGNYVGTTADGLNALGNDDGIGVIGNGNTIGGPNTGAGNVLSGSTSTVGAGAGVGLHSSAANNTIEGNLIGTNKDGTAAIPNSRRGIMVQTTGANNVVRGNVISGNSGPGIHVAGDAGITIEGNVIGTNHLGATLPNTFGIEVSNPSTGNLIGGTTPAASNVISGNSASGIVFGNSSNNQVFGNSIGTTAGGAPLPNTTHGVEILFGTGNVIGGEATGESNRIRNNGGDGVHVNSGTGHEIGANQIDNNGQQGIDLGGDGVTPNDVGDGDTGANNLQNFPVLTAATSTSVSGIVNSLAGTYTVDIYSVPSCDAGGHGEGAVHVMSDEVANATPFTFSPLPIAASGFVTATATNGSGNTSEFSACQAVSGGGGGVQPGPTYTVNTNAHQTPADSGCTVTDCTLNEAIVASNAQSGPNSIEFDITGDTQIAVNGGALEEITGQVEIDGSSQPTGTVVLNGDGAGGGDGLVLAAGSDGSTIRDLEIRDYGNSAGIRVLSSGNTIRGNELWAVEDGIVVEDAAAATNTIGGNNGEGEGNRIWDFSGDAIVFDTAGGENEVAGNTIGLDPDDAPQAIQAGTNGIFAMDTDDLIIGDDVPPEGLPSLDITRANVIVRVSTGIFFESGVTGAIVTGNRIGTDLAGDATSLGNRFTAFDISSSDGNQIGPGNIVAYTEGVSGNPTAGHGIRISNGTGNRIVANSIHSNALEGISLGSGANDDVSTPQLTNASISGGQTTISGTVSSGTTQTVHIEFFSNTSCDTSGFGEGENYLGSVTVNLADNTVPFSFGPTNIPSLGEAITATTTDQTSESTSQFSNCVTVEAGGGGGTLSGSLSQTGGNVDLTTLGTQDWALWGHASGGTSTSLAPDVRKTGGSAISALANIDAAPTTPLRGIGQFPADVPFTFTWTNGGATACATATYGGLQHDGQPVNGAVNDGFSFTVPADTSSRTLRVWVSVHSGAGRLRATLSDASAPMYENSALFAPTNGANVPGIYEITYAAASAGQTLTVEWIETDSNTTLGNDNAAIYAVALDDGSAPVPGSCGGGGQGDPPILFGAVNDINPSNHTGVTGLVELADDADPPLAGQQFELQFFESDNDCDDETSTLGSPFIVETNDNGIAAFALEVPVDVDVETAIHATARLLPNGDESELSNCVIADRGNTSWHRAHPSPANGNVPQNFIRSAGQARWFKVPIVPNSRVEFTLTGLPADYDMVLFSDIQQAYDRMVGGDDYVPEAGPNLALDDLNRAGAEQPQDVFNTSQYNTSTWDTSNYDPDVNTSEYSPSEWSPSEWSPSEWSASIWAPSEWSPPSGPPPSGPPPSGPPPSGPRPSGARRSGCRPSGRARTPPTRGRSRARRRRACSRFRPARAPATSASP